MGAEEGCNDTVAYLLHKGADPWLTNIDQDYPLNLAERRYIIIKIIITTTTTIIIIIIIIIKVMTIIKKLTNKNNYNKYMI